MIVYEVLAQDTSFPVVDAACHVLTIGEYTLRRYFGTMAERAWPLSHQDTTEAGDLILRRYDDSYESEVVLQGGGYDCNGWAVEMIVARRLEDGRLMFMLARRVGWSAHVGARLYLCRKVILERLPRA